MSSEIYKATRSFGSDLTIGIHLPERADPGKVGGLQVQSLCEQLKRAIEHFSILDHMQACGLHPTGFSCERQEFPKRGAFKSNHSCGLTFCQ